MRASDSFHVMQGSVELARKGAASPVNPGAQALVVAQGIAERHGEAVTLTVVRRPVLGPASTLYRVDRLDDGSVYTTVISLED